MKMKDKHVAGLAGVLIQILFFRYLLPWGNGLAPINIPVAFTVLYAIWSRDGRLSFLFGFWSVMAMFMGPILFYMTLPPSGALIPLLGWGVVFGFLGAGVAYLTRSIVTRMKDGPAALE